MARSLDELRSIVVAAGIPSNIKQVAYMEIELLSNMDPATAEYKNKIEYADFILALPWNKMTEDEQDSRTIEAVLSEDMHCSQSAKEALLKYILRATEKPRVLVVDDEKIARESMVYTIKKEGYSVVSANNGSEAIEKLGASKYDVVITDLIMGDVDGSDVLNEIKNKYPATKAIMVTGYATVDTAVDAMRMGAFHYIEKPLSLDELRKVVKDALKEKFSVAKKPLCLTGGTEDARLSVGMTVARAIRRRLLRIPAAGIKNLSDVRGLGRTNDGAGPGLFLKEVVNAGVCNPLIMIEGLGDTPQKDALVEVIDSDKNSNFTDSYLDAPFDMSKILFIVTSQDLDSINDPLRDMLEIIEL
jgi:ATP-dependent Lon protease